jgi:GDP-L-fucose synthase
MEKNDRIYIAGHTGMVGSAIFRELKKIGYNSIIVRTRVELDLRNQAAVKDFFETEQPEYVFIASAKVGGIVANNTFRADFIYDNLQMELNLIHHAYLNKVKKLIFLASSCIYPKFAPQPLKEEYLLTGILESTNEPYSVAKLAGLKMCEAYMSQYGANFITVMPTSLYGLNDNYHPENSHVLPSMIRKFHSAKINNINTVELWGTGTPMREFMYVDDLADAVIFLMKNYDFQNFINVGVGIDHSIRELAEIVQRVVGYKGEIVFNAHMPDGTPRKLLDSSKLLNMGWKHKIELEEGLKLSYNDFLIRVINNK